MTGRDDPDRALRRYLRDHHGASAGGVRLVERIRHANRGTEFEPGFAAIEAGIRHDQAELTSILRQRRIAPSRLKQALAWCAAAVGRTTLNGAPLNYQPLTRVVELEVLSAAVTAKLGLWTALVGLSTTDKRFDAVWLAVLQERARTQLGTLATMHREATRIAFMAPTRSSTEAKLAV